MYDLSGDRSSVPLLTPGCLLVVSPSVNRTHMSWGGLDSSLGKQPWPRAAVVAEDILGLPGLS